MKLSDIIENLDKSKQNEEWVNIETLFEEFGLSYEYSQESCQQTSLKSYWICNHLCTDTWVGFKAFFLNDEFVGLSRQSARKSSEEFEWKDAEKVFNYLLTFTEKPCFDKINTVSLDEDFGEGYYIEYSSQLLTDKVIYRSKLSIVDKSWKDKEDKLGIGHKIKLVGRENPVDIRYCKIPFKLVGELK